MTRTFLTLAVLAGGITASALGADEPRSPAMPDRLGVTHVAGKYSLTQGDFLNEGADVVLRLGSRVIKVYLCLDRDNPKESYPFHTAWPACQTLVELASTAPYTKLFDKPFTTFILTCYGPGRDMHAWRRGYSPAQIAAERLQFHDLAAHLLRRYRGTGKTFVLQHWEGDWAARGNYDPKADPTPEAFAGMAKWLKARQDGVDAARAEVKAKGARVLHAAEVNLVKASLLDGRPSVTTRVLPEVELDLVSYSAYDTQPDPALFRRALDFIAAHARTRAKGPAGVYVGEFGLPENDRKPQDLDRVLKGAIATARDWGSPFIVYWQVYCNEARRQPVKANADVRGFWLLRPDGSRGRAWDILSAALKE